VLSEIISKFRHPKYKRSDFKKEKIKTASSYFPGHVVLSIQLFKKLLYTNTRDLREIK
jgi:hypothetical protein